MDPEEIQSWLRRCGVVVHHAARMPTSADGQQSVVLYLEAALGQQDLARHCALRLPDVADIQFSGRVGGVMYVTDEKPDHGRGTTIPARVDSEPGS